MLKTIQVGRLRKNCAPKGFTPGVSTILQTDEPAKLAVLSIAPTARVVGKISTQRPKPQPGRHMLRSSPNPRKIRPVSMSRFGSKCQEIDTHIPRVVVLSDGHSN